MIDTVTFKKYISGTKWSKKLYTFRAQLLNTTAHTVQNESKSHIPVLQSQVIEYLAPKPGAVIIDATLGLGGHTKLLLNHIGSTGAVYGLDADERNLVAAQDNLKDYPNVHFTRTNFENLAQIGQNILAKEGRLDGILFDLGLSSVHLDLPERGFSLKHDGPLDMRFDTTQETTAADIVNTYSLNDLILILKTYGEEKHSNHIAQEIVKRRRQKPFTTTLELADFVTSLGPKRFHYKIHPATRVFQALRIATNREIEVLQQGLGGALQVLPPQGRIVVISYHSLEDRLVKNMFRSEKQNGTLNLLTKKPIVPTDEEITQNRRSRSAKLRAAQKL